MKKDALLRKLQSLGSVIEPMLRAGRIPGAGLAMVADGKIVFDEGYGHRDLRGRLPLTAQTIFPIASTSKSINATLLGMLVDEGKLAWDTPVQRYVPHFRMGDTLTSSRVTLRDLVTMRAGLPRHDWLWVGNRASRAELVARLAHVDLSADFRQRFQYSNVSVTAAGHVAEVVTGSSWETLVTQRIFRPLGMRKTRCARPALANVTASYHENASRRLRPAWLYAAAATAPSGGAIHSTVGDMARWLLFNLNGGSVGRRRLISAKVLAQLHAPQVVIGERPLARLPQDGTYGLGWVIDFYNGHRRISHGGYLHDVSSSIMFFPALGIGLAAFVNFGGPIPAELICEHAFDFLLGLTSPHSVEQRLAQYETRAKSTRKRNVSAPRTANTRPSHPTAAYVGKYQHAGYGEVRIRKRGRALVIRYNELRLHLRHWHYDAWIAEDNDLWTFNQPHPFDRTGQIRFYMDSAGAIAGLTMLLEPEVAPIQFAKKS